MIRPWVVFAVLASCSNVAFAVIEPDPSVDWIYQFGSVGRDDAWGLQVDDAGNTYVTGVTTDELPGQTSGGDWDGFLVKLNFDGIPQYTQQFGGSDREFGVEVALDSSANVYLLHTTFRDLPQPELDSNVRKYNSGGTFQFGYTLSVPTETNTLGIASDSSGNHRIVGFTNGTLFQQTQGTRSAYIQNRDSSGTDVWHEQFDNDDVRFAGFFDVDLDSANNTYAGGYSDWSINGQPHAGSGDAFLMKYDSSGSRQWERMFGSTGNDTARAVAADAAGNSFIGGETPGDIFATNQGGDDAFLRKYDTNGNVQWSTQFGTGGDEVINELVADADGNLYAVGETSGDLFENNLGGSDIFVVKFDPDGNVLWDIQLGTTMNDVGLGIDVGPNNLLIISGYTEGALEGTSAGDRDAFVIAFRQIPEPASAMLLMLGGGCVLRRRITRQRHV